MNRQSETKSGEKQKAKKQFQKPELHELDIKGTATGPFPDPSEFPMILQMS